MDLAAAPVEAVLDVGATPLTASALQRSCVDQCSDKMGFSTPRLDCVAGTEDRLIGFLIDRRSAACRDFLSVRALVKIRALSRRVRSLLETVDYIRCHDGKDYKVG